MSLLWHLFGKDKDQTASAQHALPSDTARTSRLLVGGGGLILADRERWSPPLIIQDMLGSLWGKRELCNTLVDSDTVQMTAELWTHRRHRRALEDKCPLTFCAGEGLDYTWTGRDTWQLSSNTLCWKITLSFPQKFKATCLINKNALRVGLFVFFIWKRSVFALYESANTFS